MLYSMLEMHQSFGGLSSDWKSFLGALSLILSSQGTESSEPKDATQPEGDQQQQIQAGERAPAPRFRPRYRRYAACSVKAILLPHTMENTSYKFVLHTMPLN